MADANRPGAVDAGLGDLLRLTLAESGSERAYVALRRDGEPRYGVAAMVRSRLDCPTPVSRSILENAFLAPGPFVTFAAGGDPAWIDGGSVRRLALRCVAGSPLSPEGRRGVLVLDSRVRPPGSPPYLRELVGRVAPLASLLLSRPPRTPAPPATEDGADWLRRVARTELPALILGETGAGKERVARRLHRDSRRAGGPLVAVNCAALSENLLDAELFGATRGAYTGAERDRPGLFVRARGGTLFLDEVGDMPPPMQAKLLRVLETRRVLPVGAVDDLPVDVRVIAATHRDLASRVAEGTFRADLHHRLAVLVVRVPPLRDRLDELPDLVGDLAPRLADETGLPAPRLVTAAWDALAAHDWPGNIRELHAVLARAMLRAGGAPITVAELRLGEPGRPRRATLERAMIERALQGSPDNLAEAARRIGWTRQKLYRRMRALGIERPAQ